MDHSNLDRIATAVRSIIASDSSIESRLERVKSLTKNLDHKEVHALFEKLLTSGTINENFVHFNAEMLSYINIIEGLGPSQSEKHKVLAESYAAMVDLAFSLSLAGTMKLREKAQVKA